MKKARFDIYTTGILLLLSAAISACQASPAVRDAAATASMSLPASPSAAFDPGGKPSPSSTPTKRPALTPAPTRMAAPTSTPTALPAAIRYASLSNANIHQLAEIGPPFQTFDLGPSFRPMSRYAQMIFRPQGTWVAEVQFFDGHQLDAHRVRVSDINGTLIKTLVDEAGGKDTQIELIVASPDGRFLAAVDVAGEHIILWDMDTLEKKASFDFRGYSAGPSTLYSMQYTPLAGSFSDDGKYLAVAGCRYIGSSCLNAGANIYDLTTNELVKELSFVQGRTADVAFQPGTARLVIAGSSKAQKNVDLLVWDVAKDEKITEVRLENGAGAWGEVAFDSTGTVFAVRLSEQELEKRISFWDTQTWSIIDEIRIEHGVGCEISTFVPGTQMLLSVCSFIERRPGHERLVFSEPGRAVPTLDLDTGLGEIGVVFASPDGRFIYTYDINGFLITPEEFMLPHIQGWGVPLIPEPAP